MAKRKLEGAEGLLSPGDAVAHVARHATGERKPPRKPASSAPADDGEPMTVTTVRIRPAHWRALHEEALRLAGPGKGRADASAVLRDVLDEWLARRK